MMVWIEYHSSTQTKSNLQAFNYGYKKINENKTTVFSRVYCDDSHFDEGNILIKQRCSFSTTASTCFRFSFVFLNVQNYFEHCIRLLFYTLYMTSLYEIYVNVFCGMYFVILFAVIEMF